MCIYQFRFLFTVLFPPSTVAVVLFLFNCLFNCLLNCLFFSLFLRLLQIVHIFSLTLITTTWKSRTFFCCGFNIILCCGSSSISSAAAEPSSQVSSSQVLRNAQEHVQGICYDRTRIAHNRPALPRPRDGVEYRTSPDISMSIWESSWDCR
jgi:hypothetical protein